MTRFLVSFALLTSLSGCIGTVVGAAVDVVGGTVGVATDVVVGTVDITTDVIGTAVDVVVPGGSNEE